MGVVMRPCKMHFEGMKNEHVIVGAGQIGPLVEERLRRKGVPVRVLRRGSAFDFDGASVVYHCANPLYDRWDTELVPLAKAIAHGAAKAGARLVALDNLYMYDSHAGPMRPDSPIAPRSKKGRYRAIAADAMFDSGAKVAIARAADFFGPRVGRSIFGDRFWPGFFAGKSVEVMGDPDQPHTYSYAPDVADGLVTLAFANDDAFGRVWHLPANPAESTRTWVERFAREAGIKTPKMSSLSPTLLRIAGLFIREAGEVPEMMYQWRAPYVLDDSDFRNAFGATPTPIEPAVRQTIAWARQKWAPELVLSTA